MERNIIDIGLNGETVLYVRELSKELTVLRMAFGRLKSTIRDAAAPLFAVFVPAATDAVFAAARLVRSIGQVAAALLGIDVIQTETKKSVTSASKAARRSLAEFDQLDRLDAPSGSAAASPVTEVTQKLVTLPPRLQAIVDQIMALTEPLRSIDLTPVQMALAAVGEAFGRVCGQLWEALEWVWYTILTPLAGWIMETLAPVLGQTLVSALRMAAAALPVLAEAFLVLWDQMKPLFSYIGQTVLSLLGKLGQTFDELNLLFRERGGQIVTIFGNIGSAVMGLCNLAAPWLGKLKADFDASFGQIRITTQGLAGFILDTLEGITGFLSGVFTKDWGKIWDGIGNIFKCRLNVIIGFFNVVIAGVTAGINTLINSVNRIGFTLPDWVPGYGGEYVGFNIPRLKAPQIPYLAQGAVLPANKPFLAMVGDQRHGTNIEAPLSTIQEAVALVMQDQTSALLAGFEASVGVQREILEAVLGIHIGDDVIGSAVTRYSRKQAVIGGGAL